MELQEDESREQVERNAGARRELARGAGMAIYRTTEVLAGGKFDEAVPGIDVALVTFAARGRRLLYSAIRLIDVGEESEAAPLLRVLHEYVIVTRWLLLDAERHAPGWALDDLRRRAIAAEETAKDEDLDDETRAAITKVGEEARAARAEYETKFEGEIVNPPTFEQMAKQAGLLFPYSFAYRLQSQADVHATALAIDKTLERGKDGTLTLREKPETGLSGFDSYQIGAHLLLDLVRPVAERWPALEWGTHSTRLRRC